MSYRVRDLSLRDHGEREKMTTKRYAVISDVHGNLPAFETVLADARERGVDGYMIAGDYCLSGPWPDGCIRTLRSLEDAFIIRGNEEQYLENLIGKDQSGWTDGQMQISYWNFRNIAPDNLEYMLQLPHTIDTCINGTDIHIAHSSANFIGDRELQLWGSDKMSKRYEGREITREIVREDILSFIESDEAFAANASALKDGIYIFGHCHLQWSYRVPGRDILFINPGSCGLPLDGIRNSIPYSILSIKDNGDASVEEIRLPFDMAEYAESIKKTTQYTEASVWTKVITKELLTAREHLLFFLIHTEGYAQRIGDIVRPFSVKTWEDSYKEWVETL